MTLRVAIASMTLMLSNSIAAAAPPSPADDVQDLVFLYDARPVFLRLHVQIDGKPFATHWSEMVAKLFKYLDADGDGVLSPKERAPWLNQLGGGNRVQPRPNNQNGQPSAARTADAIATPADLAEFLRPSFGPFQLQVVNRNNQDVETIFGLLDLDGDKALSASELEAAGSTLAKYDEDEDETIRAREVLPYQNPFRNRRVRTNLQGQPATPPVFLAIGPREPRAPLARQLLTKYDKHGSPDDGPGPDNRLQEDEIRLEPESFAAADQDGDGGLDSDELVHALASPPPSLELGIAVIRNVPAMFSTIKVVEPAKGEKASPLASAVRKGAGNDLLIALDSDLVQVHLPRQNGVNLRQFYQQQFKAADGDNNKYLDKKEAQGNGIFNNNFDLMDRDGDGKLFEEEMNAFVGRQADAAESRTLVSVSDQGRSLFQVLDLNRDGGLGVRELRDAVKKLAQWDRDGDGKVALAEIPRHYRLDFGPGSSPLLINFGVQQNDEVEMRNNTGGAAAGKGPSWFHRMDLNRDGDVSAREFLGPRDVFRRLDADHDGLIDPAEAARAR